MKFLKRSSINVFGGVVVGSIANRLITHTPLATKHILLRLPIRLSVFFTPVYFTIQTLSNDFLNIREKYIKRFDQF